MKARIVALAAASLVGLAAGSCASNTQSLVILQNDVPEVSGGACVAPAGASTTFRASGTLDIGFFSYGGVTTPTAGYLLFPAVQNNLTSTVGGAAVGIDDTAFNIELTRIDVELVDATNHNAKLALNPNPFSVPVFKVMKAGDVVGLAVDVVPAGAIGLLYDGELLTAKVTVVGNRDGGEMRSNTMDYAISICDGCLLQNAGACTTFSGAGTANECNIAQDEVAVCCESTTLGLVCPAVAEAAPSG